MERLSIVMAILSLSAIPLALAQSSPAYDINKPSDVTSTVCGDIVHANLYDDHEQWFLASQVIDCLTSIPFIPAVGTRFVKWWNDTLQYHASTAYLRNPPTSYQQPPLDIYAALQAVQDKIDAGYYKNEYAFEADIQAISQQAHDIHLTLSGGALYAFTFSSPFYISTISVDGKQAPKVYLWEDLVNCAFPSETCSYSAISNISGVEVTQYLKDYAAKQSYGFVDPNADWQNLMYTPAQSIELGYNAFTGAANFFPGIDLVVDFENGTFGKTEWVALYNSPGFTGPLATAGDFYNYFVLGLPPANIDSTYQQYIKDHPEYLHSRTSSSNNNRQYLDSWTSVIPAYPKTISHQARLGQYSPGFVTGYYLDSINTAVLSIPSFQEYGQGINTFSTSVGDFVRNATQRNASRVIIDLQQNSGGQASLAFDTFRWFFPSLVPFAGSRRRSFEQANLLGDATTAYFETLQPGDDNYYNTVSSEWVATELINAMTNANFTSWQQLYGPLEYNDDFFSMVQRYNLSSRVFNNSFLDINFPECFYNRSCPVEDPWTGKDIIVLTDGLCTSACTLFVEMMTRDAGAHSVVVGGQPSTGPMQIASGSRGAAEYSRSQIDLDLSFISPYNATLNQINASIMNPPINTVWAGFTLRDQIRNDSNIPNQFQYLPADCRLYWSLANANNYTRLWEDTYSGIFGDGSICVAGSRGITTPPKQLKTRTADGKSHGPLDNSQIMARSIDERDESHLGKLIMSVISDQSSAGDYGTGDVRDGAGALTVPQNLIFCSDQNGNPDDYNCPRDMRCVPQTWDCLICSKNNQCAQSQTGVTWNICERQCSYSLSGSNSNPNAQCGAAYYCNPDDFYSSSSCNVPGAALSGRSQLPCASGWCEPNLPSNLPYCSQVQSQSYLQSLAAALARSSTG